MKKLTTAIVLLSVIFLTGCTTSNYEEELYDFSDQVTTNEYYEEGTYLVGTDIDAGDYVILGEDGYFELCLTVACVIDDGELLYNELFGARAYVTLIDGQYIVISRGQMFKDEYYIHTLETEITYSAFYLIGEDLEAGTYTLTGDGWYNLCTKPTCDYLLGEEISTLMLDDSSSFDLLVEDGQYLYIYNKVTGQPAE